VKNSLTIEGFTLLQIMKSFTAVIVTSIFLVACDVGPNQYDGDINDGLNPTNDLDGNLGGNQSDNQVCAEDLAWFEEGIWQEVIQPTCLECHTESGLALTSKLVFDANSVLNSYSHLLNYSAVAEQAQWLLEKPSGQVIHGGGEVISQQSAAYQSLVDWLAQQDQLGQCEENEKNIWQGIGLLTSSQTLRKAALLLAGRLPTAAETNTLAQQGDEGLKALIRGLMVGDDFTAYIEEGANSQLLTDKWNNERTPAVDLIYESEFYPNVNVRLGPLLLAIDNAADDDALRIAQQEFSETWLNTNYGLAKAPLKLFSYIVNNERPYSEILIADYLMVNPYSNEIYLTGLTFSDNDDKDLWQPGRITDGYLKGAIPHAGVLTDTMWLARYPSTDTNRNRARARWAYYFFLGVDIEASSTRPTDAAALMDTDNPTLNNPACTVCHVVMDPVAGAFQNFGHTGNFDDVTYLNWYSDMLAPGFNQQAMPSSDHNTSLSWLGHAMVADDRFASGAVKFWWPAIYGKALASPVTSVQQSLIDQLALGFRSGTAGTAQNGNLNLKDLWVDMILAEPFRAVSAAESSADLSAEVISQNSAEITSMGVGQLLTPEQLNRKLAALLGKYWTHAWDASNTQLLQDYYGLFGGIDSDGVTQRATELNTLMSAVAGRMANEMPCRVVIDEFELPQAQRLLFNLVEMTDTPATNDSAVRAQVNQLLDRLWGNQVHTDLALEQEQAYQLFNAVWSDRVANAPSTWLYYNDETMGPQAGDDDEFCILDWDNEQALRYDDNHTVRSWMALLTYLLSDYSLLYE
jgi:hypothetical protein